MKEFRAFLIKIWVGYCFFVFAATELLSVFNLIYRPLFIIIYAVGGIIILVFIFRKLTAIKINIQLSGYWKWYGLLFLIVLLPLLLIALYYPPNNYDSMTYHLPRVEHWIRDRNVSFYQTNNSRQLFMSPLSEYVILHWRILVGEDNLVSLVQYVSMFLSAMLVTLIVRVWKGSKLAEVLAATLLLTLPMGILQSTSTQNDYVTAFFVLAAIYFYLVDNNLFLAISIGLGIFTKSTFIIFVLPLGLYWLLIWIKNEGFKVWKRVGLIFLFVVIINGPQWLRNYKYFGLIFGPKDMSVAMFNTSFAPKYVISNIVKNTGVQIALPNKNYNSTIDVAVENIHKALGIRLNDPINSWYSMSYVTQFAIHEDLSGNIIVFLLFFTVGFILILKRYLVWPTYLALLIGWIIFCALLKWQPWHSRLELPFFVASIPLIAIVLTKSIKSKIVLKILMLIIILLSIPFVVGYLPKQYASLVINESNRPITTEMLSFRRPRFERVLLSGALNPVYYEAVVRIKKLGINNLLLDLDGNSWEYPLYVALRYEKLSIKVSYPNSVEATFEKPQKYSALLTDKELSTYNKYKIDKSKIDKSKIIDLSGLKIIIF